MHNDSNNPDIPKVLIIDDYEMTCIAVSMFFAEFGFICDVAHNAKNGLDLALMKQDYDIILVDLHLPDDNGLNLVKALRANRVFCKTKIIIFTGNDNNTLNYYKQNGVDGVLIKPCNKEKILEIINMPNRYP